MTNAMNIPITMPTKRNPLVPFMDNVELVLMHTTHRDTGKTAFLIGVLMNGDTLKERGEADVMPIGVWLPNEIFHERFHPPDGAEVKQSDPPSSNTVN